ncbi:MAG TPA: carbonic anhydrase [Gemmatimonadales bacterium]|nr:carbonic anhydrase [Gemmatimonadales bacterium]
MTAASKTLTTRREVLRRISQTAAALALSPTLLSAGQLPSPALRYRDGDEPATPEAALEALREGNRRFAAGKGSGPHRDLARVKAVAAKQTPFAAVLTCADSRLPVEILFDQGFGDVFVCRNAGNVVTSEEIASLEFGTLVLGAKVLLVLGHSACGAVKASLAGEPVPGQISALYQHIRPAITGAGSDVEKAVAANVQYQTKLLESSPVLTQLVKERKLLIAGAVYDLATGRVREL